MVRSDSRLPVLRFLPLLALLAHQVWPGEGRLEVSYPGSTGSVTLTLVARPGAEYVVLCGRERGRMPARSGEDVVELGLSRPRVLTGVLGPGGSVVGRRGKVRVPIQLPASAKGGPLYFQAVTRDPAGGWTSATNLVQVQREPEASRTAPVAGGGQGRPAGPVALPVFLGRAGEVEAGRRETGHWLVREIDPDASEADPRDDEPEAEFDVFGNKLSRISEVEGLTSGGFRVPPRPLERR